GDERSDKPPSGRSKLDRFPGPSWLSTHMRERLVARPVIWETGPVCCEDLAEDLAEAPAFILHPSCGGRYQYERWRVCRIGHEWRRRAGAEDDTHHQGHDQRQCALARPSLRLFWVGSHAHIGC